jgi:RNA-binding protein YhbY
MASKGYNVSIIDHRNNQLKAGNCIKFKDLKNQEGDPEKLIKKINSPT